MKPGPSWLIVALCLACLSCERLSDSDLFHPGDSFYFNSFESYGDTIGWVGIGMENFVKEAPKTGGTYSVKISGGCVIPHACYLTGPVEEDCSFVLKCWGKNLSNGGSVSLMAEEPPGGIYIPVSETSWTGYICQDTLYCTSGTTLRLELNSGGLMGSSMLVDQIEISRVEN